MKHDLFLCQSAHKNAQQHRCHVWSTELFHIIGSSLWRSQEQLTAFGISGECGDFNVLIVSRCNLQGARAVWNTSLITWIHIQMEMRNRRVNTSSDHHWISTSLCLGPNYTTVYVHTFKLPLHHMKYWFQSERRFERRQTQIHSTGYWCLPYGARELRVRFTSRWKSINTAARTKSAHLVHHYPK